MSKSQISPLPACARPRRWHQSDMYQINRLWGGVVPILSTNLLDAGLVGSEFNVLLTKGAVTAFDDYTAASSSSLAGNTDEVSPTGVPLPSSATRRRRRPRASVRDVKAEESPILPSALTPNDRFFEHQRTRGYRLATQSMSSCDSAKQLEEDYIVDAVAYYLRENNALSLADLLSSSRGGGELSIDMWAAVQRGAGACHRDHVHEGAIVSGVYYSAVPLGSAPLVLRKPTTYSRDENAQVDQGDVVIHPKEGNLILFPPWLEHGVPAKEQSGNTDTSNQPRVSFAFNLIGRMATIGNPWDVILRPSSS